MPCYDPPIDPKDAYQRGYRDGSDNHQTRRMEAFLCGIMTALTKEKMLNVLDAVNWPEVGERENKRDFLRWWEAHQWLDNDRKQREKTAAENSAKRKIAIAKLSNEERVLLGLSGSDLEITQSDQQ